jgi:hypothetical protein
MRSGTELHAFVGVSQRRIRCQRLTIAPEVAENAEWLNRTHSIQKADLPTECTEDTKEKWSSGRQPS